MEAREENCSFVAELLSVVSRPSPSPSHLLGGACVHAGAASFFPPPSFAGQNSGWPCVCVSDASDVHLTLDVIYGVTAWRLSGSFLHVPAERRLHSADVGLYLGGRVCVTWGLCTCSMPKSYARAVWWYKAPVGNGTKSLRPSGMGGGGAGYG